MDITTHKTIQQYSDLEIIQEILSGNSALFEILKYQGCRNVYAGITLPNDKSTSFHKKFGFSKIAEYKNIGYKLGLWNTVSWWELKVNDYSDNPTPPMKFSDMDNKVLEKCLAMK